jgi:hypothetical protein
VCLSLQGHACLSAAARIFSAGKRNYRGRYMTLQLGAADNFVVIMISPKRSLSITFNKLKFMDIKGKELSENLEMSAMR